MGGLPYELGGARLVALKPWQQQELVHAGRQGVVGVVQDGPSNRLFQSSWRGQYLQDRRSDGRDEVPDRGGRCVGDDLTAWVIGQSHSQILVQSDQDE